MAITMTANQASTPNALVNVSQTRNPIRSITTCVLAAPPRMVMRPLASTAVITPLARFWLGPNQLMLELPGHGMPAGKTATNSPLPSVSVTVRLMTAPPAPGSSRAIVRSSPSASLPPVTRVSSTRGLAPTNGMNDRDGGV
jgi:hypothetical protein